MTKRLLSIATWLLLSCSPASSAPLAHPAPSSGAEIGPLAHGTGADASWWQTVSSRIEGAEYGASTTATGLQAPNRAQDLRTFFNPEGIEVVPRQTGAASAAWRFTWSTSRVGRGSRMQPVDPIEPEREATGARVRYTHPGLIEWYENGKHGLEQGFTLNARPPGRGSLRIEARVGGALRAEQREDGMVDWIDPHGARVLRYAQLRAWDADGRALPSRLAIADDNLTIEVEDGASRYPITIDPLMTSPAWTAESDQVFANFGASVSTAGDVNGDGFSDVIVGAWNYDGGEFNEGRAYVYLGSASGLATSPAWTAECNQASASFGAAVGAAGDVNGDGFADVIVGAYGYDNDQTDEGRAFVYHGSASGLAASPTWTAETDQASAFFGYSVGTAGDVNGDGYADVIVSAINYSNGQTGEGRAFVYHGSSTGLAASAAWTAEGNQPSVQFGTSVSTAGDVNGDGFADVIVGAVGYSNGQTGEGRAFVFHGSGTGLSTSAQWTAESDQVNAFFGNSVGTAGDVNGDGFGDVIVGAHAYDNAQSDEGRVYVYRGSGLGLSPTALWTAEGNQNFADFGHVVGTAGDVNGDGFADVIVGAPYYDNAQTDDGVAYIYYGSAGGPASVPSSTLESDQGFDQFGISVAAAGDVNGDGYSDVIVGADQYDNGQTDEGRAFVYHGSASGLAVVAAWAVNGSSANAEFGYSVATAGDVNGDGFSDVIVGAPQYGRAYVFHGSAAGLATLPAWTGACDQDAYFGFSVGTAGDVNGDGFSDVIVGATYYSNGQAGEGRAFVYHGSSSGLATTPAWTAESDQASAFFGRSVGTAGDVNGDGFSDVIVGAYKYHNGEPDEGGAFVYLGSSLGLAATAAWTVEGNQPGVRLGMSAGTAGDVNGDGYSDVIVGAVTYGQNGGGAALVYHGSPAGLTTTPAWVGQSDQAGADLGYPVGTAGDVNGDGYSDVIVGAMEYDNGQMLKGRAFVFLGSFAGLVLFPAWSAGGIQDGSGFAGSLGSAGDVNGDGFSDVIIGSPGLDDGESNEGGASTYHGSASGPGSAPAWSVEGNVVAAYLGISVATAGDVNGDGFSDVIVGVYGYNSLVGRAVVYYGNRGDGLDRTPRQVRTDDSAPISVLGRSNATNAFRLEALGRTPAGRGKVRLQREVKPFGTPFNGSGLVTGLRIDTGIPTISGSTVPLSELATGLTPGTPYHWRERIVTDSPFFPHSPWFSPVGNAPNEADLRTAPAAVGVPEPFAAAQLWLGASTPNPFTITTQLAYTLPHRGQVRLAIYDIAGQQVAVLADGVAEAGRHTLAWGGRDDRGAPLSAGVYFARLQFAGSVEARKIVFAR